MFGSLNIGYIFLRIYEFFTGIHIDYAQISDTYSLWVGQLAMLGFLLAVVILILRVYVQIRLLIVEHEGFHAREETEHTIREHHAAAPANARWEQVMALAASQSDSDWRRAILEADVMLGELLTERGFNGSTLGEQLKNANPLQFTTLDLAWQAHKMRNALAHLGEAFPLSERDARATIDLYKRVFEEFGII